MNTVKDIQELIAQRAAKEIHSYATVNLGIGIPTLIAKYVDADKVFLHTENGMLGVGELKDPDQFDPGLVNAGKLPIAEETGASYFHSADSFAMIRGGHIDIAFLGALQVDESGYIANWAVPGKNIMGVGGAMDLLSGARKIVITTNHCTKNGEPKLVKNCSYPITSTRKVDTIITELAVFEFIHNRLELVELMPGVTLHDVRRNTEADYEINLREAVEGE